MPPKGQEMDDHYYGVIRERIGSYMKELNEELWKLGVTAKTQHNEVVRHSTSWQRSTQRQTLPLTTTRSLWRQ